MKEIFLNSWYDSEITLNSMSKAIKGVIWEAQCLGLAIYLTPLPENCVIRKIKCSFFFFFFFLTISSSDVKIIKRGSCPLIVETLQF